MRRVQQEHAPTVSAILDRYEREIVPTLAPRTQKDYARHLVKLRATFGDRIAADLQPRDFGPFLHVDHPLGKGKIQRVRQLAVLSAAFTQAVSFWYILERNVLRDVKRPKSRPRTRYITDSEFDAIKALAPIRIKLAMDLALITGQRQGDLLSLKWEQIVNDTVQFTQAKTGKKLAIRITAKLEAVLDRCWMLPKGGHEGNEYVLPTKRGTRYTSEGFRAGWQRVMRKCMKTGALKTRGTFHDLRAKSGSDAKSLQEAFERLGHSSIAMTRRCYDRAIRTVEALE
jgi:integrase